MKNLKVIISGGGTGGHIYPAVAIANALKEVDKNIEILFVGAEGRMEMQKVPAAGYDIIGLPISGIQRKLTMSNLLFPFKVLKSFLKARSVIKNFKPDIAIGVGGYASFPLLYIASLLKIPTIIQEQNSYAGISNKYLSKAAERICVAYQGMGKFFPEKKIILTGNPVRKDILEASELREEGRAHFGLRKDLKTILVIGGSLGARTINESIMEGLEKFKEANVQLLWQTGKNYFNQNEEKVKSSICAQVKIHEFIYEMKYAYAAADIVISRAGALSISELCLVGKPSILVPSPNVAEDHQTKNAKALSTQNAAMLITDNHAKNNLVDAALNLLNDYKMRTNYSENIKKLGRPFAANDIAKIVIKIIKEKSIK